MCVFVVCLYACVLVWTHGCCFLACAYIYVDVCICVCACICICIWICICICICICMYVCTYVCMYVCVCVCMYVRVHVYVHIHMYTYTRTYIHTFIHHTCTSCIASSTKNKIIYLGKFFYQVLLHSYMTHALVVLLGVQKTK